MGFKSISRFVVVACLASACGGTMRQYPLRQTMWTDPDQNPFAPKPEEYFSPFAWDAVDQTVFRPVSRFFAVDPAGESINVNAMDEVPDSSWFTNRIGRTGMSVEEVAEGACAGIPPLDPSKPWKVTGAKPNGANPGFIIEGPDGKNYLLKFDGLIQPERATSADVVGSLLYWATGYFTPCNRVVFFERDILQIGEGAEAENDDGDDVPMTDEHIAKVLSKGVRLPDGRYRASASLFLEGDVLGPWTYNDRRDDDPNDVVAHEDRRDLRGSYVIASWLNHFDAREQNTLSTWIETNGNQGYVRHNFIDFGDCLGSLWDIEGISRRLGYSYYLDIPYLLEDFGTLGLIERPWDTPHYGRSGAVFAYFRAQDFEPDKWRPGYPNPAMGRMSERDAAWMARIIARFDNERVRAVVDNAHFQRPLLRDELIRILAGRRQRILQRWFQKLSPLASPEISPPEEGASRLCFTDLSSKARVAPANRRYQVRGWVVEDESSLDGISLQSVNLTRSSRICATLPSLPSASRTTPRYMMIDFMIADPDNEGPGLLRAHLYDVGSAQYELVGIERLEDDNPPG